MNKITISTSENKQIVDITDEVTNVISEAGVKSGLVNVFIAHTTCAVTTADLDPGTDQDYLDAIEKMFPKGQYRHPHDPSHVGDHIMSSIIGSSTTVPIEKGKLVLGTWQRVVLVELNGARDRCVYIKTLH